MKPPSKPLIATTSTLAHMLGLGSRRVQQLVQLKILPRPRREGQHNVTECVRAYVSYLQRPTQTKSLAEAKQRKLELECQLKKLDLDVREGALVVWAVVDRVMFSFHRQLRDNFQNLPARCAGLVSAESNQHRCYEILAHEVRQILEELSSDKEEDLHAHIHDKVRGGPIPNGRPALTPPG